ncbi:MAG: trypsin-like peptidase domain-containing protein [Proteobacteria bacterium]|nr:trypsin-like peptidase domain-containing protein [Pseudomonadota bacterium]
MRRWAFVALAAAGLAFSAGGAHAADEARLKKLKAPPPAAEATLPADVRAVKFQRLLVELKPEPWAFLRNEAALADDKLLSWKEGEKALNPSAYGAIFDEELRRASGKAETTASGGLFPQAAGPPPDLLAAVKITAMEGRFCKACNFIGGGDRWEGAVVMTAHWEVYSTLDRKVVFADDITGGFNAPSKGMDGDPDRLIAEAFRDNVRRLIAAPGFRKAVAAPTVELAPPPPPATPIALVAERPKPAIAQASASVAVVFTPYGSGSGFLVSDDGYVLTNHHVVGEARAVKLKWSDGTESLGQVIRSDAHRDVALVKAEAGARPALAIRHGEAQQGETVFAIGSPLGDRFQNTMSKGIVSALRVDRGQPWIQSDVMVNHGSSGGPLLDEAGRVIGLTASGQVVNGAPVGINFFIPIDDALKVLNLTAPADPAVRQAAAHTN